LPLVLREEHELRMYDYDSKVLKVYGPKREEITAGCRKLLIEELHNFHSSPNISMMIKSGRMRWSDERSAYEVLVGKTEGKRPQGRYGNRS
jgi:hypothetical protein